MKFGLKLVLYIIVIITCILSFSRYFIIRQSFTNSMKKRVSQNENNHITQKYYLESNIIKNIQDGKEMTAKELIEYVKSLYSYLDNSSEKVALYINKELVFSNFDKIDDIWSAEMFKQEPAFYNICKFQNNWYMIFPSHLTVNGEIIYIANIYDITDIYDERDRQIKDVIFADFVILGVASIFITILSSFLVKPIKTLNVKAKKIASGEFNTRVLVQSKDEIGELAKSFNTMSEEIEGKINSLNLSIKQKNDFINSFTHELKTPMTSIIGYSDMLRLKKCNEEVTKKALNYIYSEAKRLEILSHRLMDLMSLSGKEITLDKFEAKDFLNKVSQKVVVEPLDIKLFAEASVIVGDKTLLEVVIRNLIENAKKAEPKDGLIVIRGKVLDSRQL
ncbi:MAG: HAMP domain-containing histidine kinase [Clostridia bacterium]|nr:HAMP domain-containing histidine kinase [Clostridia bacterium]